MSPLPPLLPVAEIQRRLASIFPEGTPRRAFCVREIAARTIFVMLYVGAIEGSGRHLRPDQVTRMTMRQARKARDDDRRSWADRSLARSEGAIAGRWYAANTREPIRDETLREGLMRLGAVVSRRDLPTTSAHPRYALSAGFSRLFDPELTGSPLHEAIAEWRGKHLSVGARMRIELLRRAAVASSAGVQVRFRTAKPAVSPRVQAP